MNKYNFAGAVNTGASMNDSGNMEMACELQKVPAWLIRGPEKTKPI